MSDTRRKRQQLRQSLVQHVFHYYEELKMTHSEEDAKREVAEIVTSSLSSFMRSPTNGASLFSLLEEWETEWLNKQKDAVLKKDYDGQYEASDALQALLVLKPLAKEKDDDNGIK